MVRIALVNSVPDILKPYSTLLAKQGYEIAYTAKNGAEAVGKNTASPAQIIIMDYVRSAANKEAVKKILAEYPFTQFIFLVMDHDTIDPGIDKSYYSTLKMLCGIDELLQIIGLLARYEELVEALKEHYGEAVTEELLKHVRNKAQSS